MSSNCGRAGGRYRSYSTTGFWLGLLARGGGQRKNCLVKRKLCSVTCAAGLFKACGSEILRFMVSVTCFPLSGGSGSLSGGLEVFRSLKCSPGSVSWLCYVCMEVPGGRVVSGKLYRLCEEGS
jgi:hypothetical protein